MCVCSIDRKGKGCREVLFLEIHEGGVPGPQSTRC